jgi:hypothetical protein
VHALQQRLLVLDRVAGPRLFLTRCRRCAQVLMLGTVTTVLATLFVLSGEKDGASSIWRYRV